MDLITINRKIVTNLTEELQIEYIEENVYHAIASDPNFEETFEGSDIQDYLVKGIHMIIKSNEDFHAKYGKDLGNGKKLVLEGDLVPSGEEPTGFFHSTGKYVICPFDWALNDEFEFDYTFYIAKSI